ncbi:hypothetical protein OPQ81_005938 [Rhizoctonia solani]|nr:hypothetical protein OPQ81_005938 [Rhizoctonia solani]
MASTIGVPVKLLHEALGHIITVELKSGALYRGKLADAEDSLNISLKDITVTGRDGKVSQLDQVYIRGSMVRFFIVPDMLQNAPMFKRVGPNAMRGRGIGTARGRATIMRGTYATLPTCSMVLKTHICVLPSNYPPNLQPMPVVDAEFLNLAVSGDKFTISPYFSVTRLTYFVMPPRSPPKCQICETEPFKYTCPTCRVLYCSLACYKKHKSDSEACATASTAVQAPAQLPAQDPDAKPDEPKVEEEGLSDPKPLRTLASLKWPYVPEPPSYVDPVTKNDPKPLTLPQYEAIATSPEVRKVLAENPDIRGLLRSIDKLYGPLRQQAIEEVLGVETSGEQRHGTRAPTHDALARLKQEGDAEANARALRQLSEAIEKAIGVGAEQRGLAWEDA